MCYGTLVIIASRVLLRETTHNMRSMTRLSKYLLRLLPIMLPLIAICSALAGLTLRTSMIPSGEILALVVLGTLLSGILPACFLVGAVFLVADILQLHRGRVVLAVAAVVASAIGLGSFYYGQGLDF